VGDRLTPTADAYLARALRSPQQPLTATRVRPSHRSPALGRHHRGAYDNALAVMAHPGDQSQVDLILRLMWAGLPTRR